MRKCIICDSENIEYPVMDYSTGFTFCDGCWFDTTHSRSYNKPSLAEWLRMIADTRDSKKLDVENVHFTAQKIKEKRQISY